MMKFVSLGASDEIGASCHYLELDGTGILLDTGADPEEQGEASLPRLALIEQDTERAVDHAFVTHAHHDHIGSLPLVLKTFPHARAHMTHATRQLLEILLPASARLQRRRMMEGTASSEPLFSEEDLSACSYLYETHDLDVTFDVTGYGGRRPVRATLMDAGHVLGACGIHLEYEEGDDTRRIFYTSDTGVRSQTILPGASYPAAPLDVLLLETTLGADPEAENVTRRREEERLGQSIATVLGQGGVVLLPVFALGRAQEIIALLDRYKRTGLVSEDVPVYSAGLMRAISDIYDKTRLTTPRLDENFQVFGVNQRRLPRNQTALAEALSTPGIHVVGSGMMFERTISNRLAQRIVESDKNAVFLVGYAREDSPARNLLEAGQNGDETEVILDRLRGAQTVRCGVDRFRLSGHSHRRDLIEIVERLQPSKVVLVHGETASKKWVGDTINFFYPDIEIFCPATGEELNL